MSVVFWTRLSIAGLIVVPPVIFVLFLKDAAALLQSLRTRPHASFPSDDVGPRGP